MLKLKNYTREDLEAALTHLHGVCEPDRVLEELGGLIYDELKRRSQPSFVKATDEFIDALHPDEAYTRPMKPTDAYYVKGFVGLFLKDGDRLLRRHSDTGLLKRPGKVIRGPL
jgi:hypothetical protein